MLDFRNYFSPAVSFCGGEAAMLCGVCDTTSTMGRAWRGRDSSSQWMNKKIPRVGSSSVPKSCFRPPTTFSSGMQLNLLYLESLLVFFFLLSRVD